MDTLAVIGKRFIYNWRSLVTTHQPVLYAVATSCGGPIAEFGCGHGSTPLLHEVAGRQGLRLLSLEDDPEWLERFRHLETDWHEFRFVEDWQAELDRSEWGERWGLIFIDNEPWDARALAAKRLCRAADFVVIHDSDYAATNGLFGRAIRPLRGTRDRGERDYGDLFSSWHEFFPPDPWPWPPTGPPTLLGSNFRDVSEIDVDFEAHLPHWWRLLSHLRRVVPQSLRRRIGNRIGWRSRPRQI